MVINIGVEKVSARSRVVVHSLRNQTGSRLNIHAERNLSLSLFLCIFLFSDRILMLPPDIPLKRVIQSMETCLLMKVSIIRIEHAFEHADCNIFSATFRKICCKIRLTFLSHLSGNSFILSMFEIDRLQSFFSTFCKNFVSISHLLISSLPVIF